VSIPQVLLISGCGVMVVVAFWCQKIRYPAFLDWGIEEFTKKHEKHTLQVSLWVIPGMLAQLAGTLGLVYFNSSLGWLLVHSLLCVASIGPTLCVSGPIHRKLSKGKDDELIRKLIRTNSPRTIAWGVQFILSLITPYS
jgi:hypothetical protein